MKHRIRWIAVLMCGALLFSSCSSVNDIDSQKPGQSEADPTDAPVAQPTVEPAAPTPEPTSEPIETPDTPPTEVPAEPPLTTSPAVTPAPFEQETTLPLLSIQPEELTWYAEDGSTVLCNVTDFTIDVAGDEFDALRTTLQEAYPGIQEAEYNRLVQDAIEHYTEFTDSFYSYYSSNVTAEIARCDSKLVSLRIHYNDYTGGAHGMYYNTGATYTVQNGSVLDLQDLIADVEGFYPHAIDYINDTLFAEYGDELSPSYKEIIETTINPNYIQSWYLTSAGIVICFSPYELGPYAMGAPEITLPYAEFAQYLHEEYLFDEGELVSQVNTNQDLSYLAGASEPIVIETVMNDWSMLDTDIVMGSQRYDVGEFTYIKDAYVFKRSDDRCFLLIAGDCMSDDFTTYVFEITDGNICKCDELFNAHPSGSSITSTALEMQVHLDVLGSYNSYTMYDLALNGELVHSEKTFPIHSQYALTTKLPLPVTIDGTETVLDVGTQIFVLGTNNVNKVYFNIEGTTQNGTIYYTRDEESWYLQINGVSEYDYFEMIPYAG